MKKTLLLAFCMLTSMICNALTAEKFVSGGRNRTMIVYSPKNLPKNRPLMIVCHGMNQSAEYMTAPDGNYANFEAVADTAKFVVVYPNGEGNAWDISGDKDINFVLDIINEMVKRYDIDKNRVYLSGFSMGGMFTYHCMNKVADKFAAFAPISGYPMGGPNAQSSRPVPFIHTHGTGDGTCGYSAVQSHLNAWVARNKCRTTPKVEKPKSGPTNTTAELIRYIDGEGGVEVAHLKLPDKGHWVSNDPNVAMSNVEIWRFVSRWSLTPGPELVSVSPEDGSFDMSVKNDRTFTFKFDKPIDCSKVKLSMSEGTSAINFSLTEKGFSSTLTFTIPEGTTPKETDYRMQLREIYAEDGSSTSTQVFHYSYGVKEVSDVMHIDTILSQDWSAMNASIGEGIPFGWHRVNSKSDGSKDEKFSGDANTGGARMKYFVKGGDIDAGFYFSSRDFEQATFTYGETTGYTLPLTRGFYNLSFRSTYWNDGAKSNDISYGVSVINTKNSNTIFSASPLKSSGTMSEKSDKQVTQSTLHELTFEVQTAANYLLQFNISAGWDGVILGSPVITRRPSQAELYKGEFLRALHKAQKLAEELKSDAAHAAQVEALNNAISKHESLSSISPSVYEKARTEILDAMKPLIALAIDTPLATTHQQDNTIYDLFGRRVITLSRPGIYIKGGKKILITK